MNNWRDDLYQDMLLHDGQKGMKWGRRRYRNYDGTLTPAGRERYGVGPAVQNVTRKLSRKERKAQKEIAKKASAKAAEKAAKQAAEESKHAAEEARQAQKELRKEREDYEQKKLSDAAGHATAEGNAQKRLDADLAKMNNDILREMNNRIKLEREYNDLVHPKDNTQREGFIKRAAANVQSIKGVISNVNDIAKMVSDIKKAFKGDKESEYDLLKKAADIDKLKYDMETRKRSRKKWADDDVRAAANHSENLDEFLEHHGILGMKWGVRRYQNYDGTLTAAGKKRFTNANREKRDRLLQVRKQDLLKGKSGSFSAMSELAENILDTEFTSKQKNDIVSQYCYYLQSALQAKNLEHVNEEMYQEKPEGITAIDFVRANNVLFEMNDQRDKSFERWQETFRKDYLDKVGLPKEKLDKVGPLAEGVFREALEASLNETPLATAQMRGAPKESAIDFASGERKHGDPNDRLYEIEEYENRHGKGSYQELIDHFKKG